MHDVVRDFVLAVRGALRRPGYSLAVIATLAIGIGANAAIFSVFNWILFRPLPAVHAPDELVTIKFQAPGFAGSYFVSFLDFTELRDTLTSTVTGVAFAEPNSMELGVAGAEGPVTVEVVSDNYLSVMGARPQLGRNFAADEDRPGGPASAIISDGLWQRAFGRNPAVLGRSIILNGRTFTIVGVAPHGFQGRSLVTAADAWLPVSSYATLLPATTRQHFLDRRQTFLGDALARLKPGVSLAQAQAEADAAMATLPDFFDRSKRQGARATMGPVFYAGVGHDAFVLERLTTIYRLLMGAVGLLLLLACANAANLLLARSTAGRREIAVCQAIGASRARIIRQQLVEGLVLSAAAGVAGLGLAALLTSLFDGMRIVAFLPAVSGVHIDWRVILFATSASLLTGLLFATVPALVSSRGNLLGSLKDGATTTRGGRRVLRGSLVTLQIAVSVLLLFGAGLFLRTLQNIRGLDLGIQPEGIVSFSIQPSRFGMSAERSIAYIESLLERLRNAPGITHAAFAWATSFSTNMDDSTYTRVDGPGLQLSARETTVSPRFFDTMGISLIAGRDFTEAEKHAKTGSASPVIVSRSFADRLFPDGGALGSRLKRAPEDATVEIVGIVADVRGRVVSEDPEPWVYSAGVTTWGAIQVRSPLPATQVISIIRETARAIDPVVAPHAIETFGDTVNRALSEQRLFARVSTIFALIAAVLASVGIYSMMAGAVAERRKEFGVRLALGATAAAIMALVMRSSTLIASFGLGLGFMGAAALGPFVESRLYNVSSLDPVSVGIAGIGILVLTLTASLVPAIRATRIDPVRSLRVE